MHSDRFFKMMPWGWIVDPRAGKRVAGPLKGTSEEEKPPGWILDNPDVQRQIDTVAYTLQVRCRHSRSDLEDLKQDLRLYLIQNESNYDPNRGSVGGYVNVLLNSYLRMQIRARAFRLRRGRLPPGQLSDGQDMDSFADSAPDRDMVEQSDLLETCLERLSPQEIMLVLITLEAGQVRASAALDESRRQIRNLLDLVSKTCADLDSLSE